MYVGLKVYHEKYGWGVITFIEDEVIEVTFLKKILQIFM